MLFQVPNVDNLILIISLYDILGDPILLNIVKITNFGAKLGLIGPQKQSWLWGDAY